MEIYHQLGFRYKWNFDSLQQDQTGNGVIISPKFMERELVEGLAPELRTHAFFDPQFFVPEVARGKLVTYDFFPQVVSGGFDTEDYVENHGDEMARKCVEFQLAADFRYIIVPTR
jgi:hypothetical protein